MEDSFIHKFSKSSSTQNVNKNLDIETAERLFQSLSPNDEGLVAKENLIRKLKGNLPLISFIESKNLNEFISFKEFCLLFCNKIVDSKSLDEIFTLISENEGFLDKKKFAKLFENSRISLEKQRISAIFEFLDGDSDGLITKHDLHEIFLREKEVSPADSRRKQMKDWISRAQKGKLKL